MSFHSIEHASAHVRRKVEQRLWPWLQRRVDRELRALGIPLERRLLLLSWDAERRFYEVVLRVRITHARRAYAMRWRIGGVKVDTSLASVQRAYEIWNRLFAEASTGMTRVIRQRFESA